MRKRVGQHHLNLQLHPLMQLPPKHRRLECQPLSRQLLLALLTLNVVWNILANVIVSVLVGHGLNRHMELFSLSQLELLPAHALMIVRLVKVARVDSSARIFLS